MRCGARWSVQCRLQLHQRVRLGSQDVSSVRSAQALLPGSAETFRLTAQAAVRAIAKVADAYKLNTASKRTFRPGGAACYDSRILSYAADGVSIWSMDGRLRISFSCGDRQHALLKHRKGESDLAFMRGQWYLLASCDIPDAEPHSGPAMGVDLGIRNTAATSHGTLHSGAGRQRFKEGRHKVRASLQSRNNRRARRALKRISGASAAVSPGKTIN